MKNFTLVFIILLLFYSCKKDETRVTAPQLPPAESMVVDFGQLVNTEKSAALAKTNWMYSATTVGIWNTIVGTIFVVPVAAFKSAFNQQAVQVDNLTWQWQYSVDGFTSQYTARLLGKLEAEHVKWEMYITKAGIEPFDEFLWFEGTSKINGTSGQWILNHSAAFPEKTVQIDWKKDADQVGEIKYTYVRETNNIGVADSFKGSTLTYGLQEGEFNIYVNVHAFNVQLQTFTDSFIEWNRTSFNGHVKAEHFFNDSDWHCWDNQGNDVDCN